MYKFKIICLLILLGYCILAKAQTVFPTTPDFTDLTGSWVTAQYGSSTFPFANTGIINGRHTLITSQGHDIYTQGNLSLLPENTTRVIRLGEPRYNQSESLSYRFIVEPEKTLLLVKFAAVFNESNGFPSKNKSYFTVRVLNSAGQLIHSGAAFNLHISYQDYVQYKSSGKFPPYWYDWTDLLIDMTPYSGQEVEVQFLKSAGEPYRSDGWAYAYFTANCISPKMQIKKCNDRKFTLAAPSGYVKYSWFNGIGTQEQDWEIGDNDMRLSCTTVSANGHRTNLIATIFAKGNIPPTDRIIYDTIQQGEAYTKNQFNLSAFNNPGSYTCHHTFCDLNNCSSATLYSLFLEVTQRYYPLEVHICEGEDYATNGFEWHTPAPGLYHDTLRLISSTGQDSIVCLKLSVSASSLNPDRIQGNTSPCTGTQENYTIPYSSHDIRNFWQWEVPPGVNILGSSQSQELSVEFTDEAHAGEITLHYSTGCTNGSISIRINPGLSYQQFLTDSICSGNEYHKNDFHLPRQTKEGTKLYYQFHQTATGCDSTLSLALTVLPTPEIEIIRSDSVICEGDEIQLYAQPVGETPAEETGSFVAIGDIYCTDGNIIRPAAYATSGKTAEGVVFWVDESGQHGWIVHKENQCEDCAMITGQGITLPKGIGSDIDDQIVTDTAGYSNTQKFWESGRINDFPAVRCIAFDRGWYLPASKQLLVLAGSLFVIDESLEMIGGKILAPMEDIKYYTSTQFKNSNYVWTWEQTFKDRTTEIGMLRNNIKKMWVRSIRNF